MAKDRKTKNLKQKIKGTNIYLKAVTPIRIRRLVKAPSMFPEYERKSAVNRYVDNYKWFLRYGRHNPYYNLTGLDVKGLRDQKDYVDIRYIRKDRKKQHHQDSARAQHRDENLTQKYSLLADDKYMFYSYIEGLNPKYVPKTHLVIQGNHLIKPFEIDEKQSARDGLASLPDGKYIAKASIGAFGDSIRVLEKKDGEIIVSKGEITLEEFLIETAEEPYIIQDFIKQHDAINKIYPDAVSTLRIISTRWNEETHILASMLRMGINGNVVDNASDGGTFVGVDIDKGCLMEYGYYYDRPRETCHPDTGLVYKDYPIPYWDEAVKLVKRLHPVIFGLSTIGWDIAITETGPVIVEINWNYSVKGIQIASGGLRKRWDELKEK